MPWIKSPINSHYSNPQEYTKITQYVNHVESPTTHPVNVAPDYHYQITVTINPSIPPITVEMHLTARNMFHANEQITDYCHLMFDHSVNLSITLLSHTKYSTTTEGED